MSSQKKTSDYYKDAIKRLEAVSADFETEESVRQEANRQIKSLRTKSQEASLDEIVGRTENIKSLMTRLQSVTGKTRGAGTTEKVSDVADLIEEVRSIIDGKKT